MLAVISFALMQVASSSPPPVIKDPPPEMLMAGYDQCLGREVTRLLAEQITPEQVFDQGQAQCGFWLDAYVTKLASQNAAPGIDYKREKARFVAKVRDRNINYVRAKRGTLEAASAAPDSPANGSAAPNPPDWENLSPNLTNAMQSAKRSEGLLKSGEIEAALAEFRSAALQGTPISDGRVAFVHSIHARMIASELIWQHRARDAEPLLDALAAIMPSDAKKFWEAILQTNDVRLYIAAESNDAKKALELLGERRAISKQPSCPDQPYFPQVIAPLHHDVRIAAVLGEMGCQGAVLERLDDLASKPMGASSFERGLPPLRKR